MMNYVEAIRLLKQGGDSNANYTSPQWRIWDFDDEAIQGIVRAVWDDVRNKLDQGRYLELKALLKNMEQRSISYQRHKDQLRNTSDYWKWITFSFQLKAEELGWETLVGDYIPPHEEFTEGFVLGGSGPEGQEDRYLIVYIPEDARRGKGLPRENKDYMVGFQGQIKIPAEESWLNAINRALKEYNRARKLELRPMPHADILQFRLQLLGQAISDQ